MRFFDRLLAEASTIPAFRAGHGKYVLELLPDATVIVADNVCEYFYAVNDKEVWNLSDFPNIAPPFEHFFIEMKKPSKIVSTEYGVTPWADERPSQWGILFFAARVTPSLSKGFDWLYNKIQEFDQPYVNAAAEGLRDVQAAGGGWFISATLIWDHPKQGLEPAWSWGFGVDMKGEVVKPVLHPERWGHVSAPQGTNEYVIDFVAKNKIKVPDAGNVETEVTPSGIASELVNLLKPALLTLVFLHCKNVTTEVVTPDPALVKRRRERGRPPLCRYTTVQVHAFGNRAAPRATSGQRDTLQGHHIVRGHFKHYTPDKKLFGKFVGTYWWAMHAAGSKDAGRILKDYVIKPD